MNPVSGLAGNTLPLRSLRQISPSLSAVCTVGSREAMNAPLSAPAED
jgi:hypothetical protein